VSDMRCSILVQTRRTRAEPFDDVRMSFARWGSLAIPLLPTAYAVGCILAPLRGYRCVLAHTLSPFGLGARRCAIYRLSKII